MGESIVRAADVFDLPIGLQPAQTAVGYSLASRVLAGYCAASARSVSPSPPTYTSPTTPTGATCSDASRTYNAVFAIGSPRLKDTSLDLTRRVADQMPVSGRRTMTTVLRRFAESFSTSRGFTSVAEQRLLSAG